MLTACTSGPGKAHRRVVHGRTTILTARAQPRHSFQTNSQYSANENAKRVRKKRSRNSETQRSPDTVQDSGTPTPEELFRATFTLAHGPLTDPIDKARYLKDHNHFAREFKRGDGMKAVREQVRWINHALDRQRVILQHIHTIEAEMERNRDIWSPKKLKVMSAEVEIARSHLKQWRKVEEQNGEFIRSIQCCRELLLARGRAD